ncbi:MAG: hypothetical protein M0P73_14985 [Syntrophobacterales bacterium]|jgi:hypothetical protein|nr:hypothetical protein [Syntrophobacterales bacterium]
MIDAHLNVIAAKIGMAPHTLKVCLVVGGVGVYVGECFKNWIAPRIITWQTRKEGPRTNIRSGAHGNPGEFR